MKTPLYQNHGSAGEPGLPILHGRSLKPNIRERAVSSGIAGLSDEELLGLMIGSGIKGHPVSKLSKLLLPLLSLQGHRGPEPEIFSRIPGIGAAKAAMLSAAAEYFRRVYTPRGKKISAPQDVLSHINHYSHRNQEHFISIYLNGAHEIIQVRVTCIGLINRTIVHPREVFAPAVELRAVAVIVAHNHPSGNLEPSREDLEVTERLLRAGEIIGIGLLDHIILGPNGSASLLELGLFPG
ncbi:RadC family protein [Spirochaeta lutea]|uniref:RadC family protein n=1 Tax=Spirochaeta lutea TaxID=1480694 RepID=UPI0009DCCCF3|nr:DNA repair protein RadC [Spirochaeta lutea]